MRSWETWAPLPATSLSRRELLSERSEDASQTAGPPARQSRNHSSLWSITCLGALCQVWGDSARCGADSARCGTHSARCGGTLPGVGAD